MLARTYVPVIVSVLLSAALSARGQDYTLVDLGTLGGNFSSAYGVNTQGQVVGWSMPPGDYPIHACLYSNGVMTDLGTLGGTVSFAYGINDQGQIVGEADTASDRHAFLYQNGTMTDLGTLGGSYSAAHAINELGQVVGESNTGSGDRHAFLYDNGVMTDLGTLGGTSSTAWGINDAGQIVGSSQIAGDSATHAFLYDNGTMTDLGTLGGTNSEAYGINESGQIVGKADLTGDMASHAFLYSSGVMTDLGTVGGTNSQANGINDQGQIAGTSQRTADNGTSAFLYANGVLTDLNDVFSDMIHTLDEGRAVNSSGQIVGQAFTMGVFHGFLLSTPVAQESWTFNWPKPRSPWTRMEDVFVETEGNLTWEFTSRMLGSCEVISGPIDGPDHVRRWATALVTEGSLHGVILQTRFPPVVQLTGRKVNATAATAGQPSSSPASTDAATTRPAAGSAKR